MRRRLAFARLVAQKLVSCFRFGHDSSLIAPKVALFRTRGAQCTDRPHRADRVHDSAPFESTLGFLWAGKLQAFECPTSLGETWACLGSSWSREAWARREKLPSTQPSLLRHPNSSQSKDTSSCSKGASRLGSSQRRVYKCNKKLDWVFSGGLWSDTYPDLIETTGCWSG